MTEHGVWTRKEIWEQFHAWEETLTYVWSEREELARYFSLGKFSEVIFTGCGSSYYSSLATAPLLQALTGIRARAFPASEVLFFPTAVLPRTPSALLIATSRSGETTELIRAVETFKEFSGGEVLLVTCNETSQLATLAEKVLVAKNAGEKSVVQTKSFTSMLLTTIGVILAFSRAFSQLDALRILPDRGEYILKSAQGWLCELAGSPWLDHLAFLGSGPFFGLACEAMLATREISLTQAEAFHFLEFRHGPKSTVHEGTLVGGFISDAGEKYEWPMLQEIRQQGAKTLALACTNPTDQTDYVIETPRSVFELARGILCLPPIQLLALYRAQHKGADPDVPPFLVPVVRIDPEEVS